MKTAIPGLLAVVLLGTMAAASAYTLEGEVFAFETGPIPNASVNLWVQLESGSGYSYWWKHGPLSSNDLGLFEAPYLPYSHVDRCTEGRLRAALRRHAVHPQRRLGGPC